MIEKLTMARSLACSILCLSLFASAAGAQYKDFVRRESRDRLFAIAFDKKEVSITVYDGEKQLSTKTGRENISFMDKRVTITDDVYFTPSGLSFQGQLFLYDSIVDSRISTDDNRATIEFLTYTRAESRYAKRRRGNLFAFSQPIRVADTDFVRGLIFSVSGLIEVYGEVNRNIISLFGDIHLITGSVSRGDIASISGTVQIEEHASIYGEIYSGEKDYDSRSFRFYRDTELEPGIIFKYNRVDGLQAGGTLGFVHSDSVYPSANIGLGYAFASERWRYFIHFEQLLWRDISLKIGGKYYLQLASGDDWQLGDGENTAFALLATEDFKDYYETEGAKGWLSLQPVNNWQVEAGYTYDDTRWLRSRRHLWSLFGGSKLFRENFSTVEDIARSSGIAELNNTKNGALFLTTSFQSSLDDELEDSGWLINGEFEWSHPDFSSDFDYRRYTFQLIRYQNVTRYSCLRLRFLYGNSDGYLPMYKRFFIGGLGTLRGYTHKEFIGTRFWLANSEYEIILPTSYEASLVLFWDLGQIANDGKLDNTAEIRHDLGAALDFGSLRINVSKRLDDAENRDPKVYVRLTRAF